MALDFLLYVSGGALSTYRRYAWEVAWCRFTVQSEFCFNFRSIRGISGFRLLVSLFSRQLLLDSLLSFNQASQLNHTIHATMKRTSESPGHSGREKAYRRQNPVSCSFCRSKKLKCDRVSPCSNCVARGIDCDSPISKSFRDGIAPKHTMSPLTPSTTVLHGFAPLTLPTTSSTLGCSA